MKAIVANVLFGGILGCLGWINAALADPISDPPANSYKPLVSAKLSSSKKNPSRFQLSGRIDLVMKVNKLDRFDSEFSGDRISSQKRAYIHRSKQTDLIFGFQNTFWPSQKRKYWGVTTIQQWGQNAQQLNLSKLDYTNSAPKLEKGSSSLTISGGGKNNLIATANDSKDDYFSEFEQFRGGVTYHHGVNSDLTMGVGFVYDDLLLGFTQLTYDSDVLPIQTTLSLLAKESDVDLHSHVRFKPANNFVVNYYHDKERQKFNLNWDVISGLAFLAKGDIKSESYSTGIKVALRNDYLSFSATATLDYDRNLDLKLNSQIGQFKFAYSNNKRKSSSQLNTHLLSSPSLGFECSVFVKHQNRQVKKEQEEFVVWGGKLHSTKKVGDNKHYWTLNLGYGSGKHGKGAIVEGAIALSPDLFLKLNYQEISAVSDDTKIKLELSSK